MFKVGDIITGKLHNGYGVTNNEALMLVNRVWDEEMSVIILFHKRNYAGQDFPVANSDKLFVNTTFEEFLERVPRCDKMSTTEINNLLARYSKDIKFEMPKKDAYALSDEMRKELIEEMRELLLKFKYHPTDDGLNKILDTWCEEKVDLIRLFEKHPNYNGKFQIAFDYDFDREFDHGAILNFIQWLNSNEVRNMFYKKVKIGAFDYNELYYICRRLRGCMDVFDYDFVKTMNGKTYEEYRKEYEHFRNMKDKYEYSPDIAIHLRQAYSKTLYNESRKIEYIIDMLGSNILSQFINADSERHLNRYFPESKIKARQKTSRAINKILCMLGVDKAPNYNKEFAKFSDAINPLKIKRHTVLSIHPVDYLTMSFGNSWSSCHTIDKNNRRGIDSDHNYRGCNSSGTMSYMLDGTSCVFYTVDAKCDGNKLELEDKINRCMFHYYDNQLLQARVYPQSNDEGANNLYKDIREIVQKIFADLLEVPNYWTNKKGTGACESVTHSVGTHYRDYRNYDTCNVSTLKDDRECHNEIEIGHNPICPCCGNEHHTESNIECKSCNKDY